MRRDQTQGTKCRSEIVLKEYLLVITSQIASEHGNSSDIFDLLLYTGSRQFFPYRNKEKDRNDHRAKVRYWCGPYDAVDTLEFVHDEHKWNIEAAFSQERQEQRLDFSAHRLEYRNYDQRYGNTGPGDTYDALEHLAVLHRHLIIDKSTHDRLRACEQQYCADERNRKAECKRRKDGFFHPSVIFRRIIVADQRDHALAHPGSDPECQHVDLFGNPDAGDRFIAV